MIKKLLTLSTVMMVPYLAFAVGSNTKYYITGKGTDVTSEVKDSGKAYDHIMSNYLSPKLVGALKDMPGVTSVQLTKTGPETVTEDSYFPYKTHSRKANIFVTMNLPSKVSLLLSVEESFRECLKPRGPEVITSDEGGAYSSSSCSLESKTKITGPIAIYGSHAVNSLTGFNEDDLKGMQEITVTASNNYSGKDFSLKTSFEVNSMLFERSLARFLKAFKVQGVDMSVAGMTRQNILLGSSRAIRLVNEKILEDKTAAVNKAGGK